MTDSFTDEEKRGFYKAIYSRRDVRSHFISKLIEEEKLSKILHAAHHAPSVGFSQPWNFILIKDQETKKIIKESFDEEKKRSSQIVEEPKKSKYLSFKLEGIRKELFNNYIADGKKNWEKNKSHFKGSYIANDMTICSKLTEEK